MDSRIGLDYIVENADYTTKLGAGKIYYFFSLPSISKHSYESQPLIFLTASNALMVLGSSIKVMVIVMELLAKIFQHNIILQMDLGHPKKVCQCPSATKF